MIIVTLSKAEDKQVMKQLARLSGHAYVFRLDGSNVIWSTRYKSVDTLAASIARQMADSVFIKVYSFGRKQNNWDNKRWAAQVKRFTPRVEKVLTAHFERRKNGAPLELPTKAFRGKYGSRVK